MRAHRVDSFALIRATTAAASEAIAVAHLKGWDDDDDLVELVQLHRDAVQLLQQMDV